MRYETVNTGTSHRLTPVRVTTRKDSCGSGGKLELGQYWQGATLNASFGSKPIVGGSFGTTLTTKPIKY